MVMRSIGARQLMAGVGIVVVGTFAWAGVASAHVAVTPAEVPIGDPSSVALTVPNECTGATVGFSVQVPDGAADVAADEVPGWTSSVGVLTPTAIEWTGGSITGEDKQQFSLSLALTGEVGDVVYFPSVQTCDDGSKISWIEVPESPDAPESEHPAPSVTLIQGSGVLPSVTVPEVAPTPSIPPTIVPTSVVDTTTTTYPVVAPDLSQVNSGLSNGALMIIVTVLAVLVAAGLVLYARRNRSDEDPDADTPIAAPTEDAPIEDAPTDEAPPTDAGPGPV